MAFAPAFVDRLFGKSNSLLLDAGGLPRVRPALLAVSRRALVRSCAIVLSVNSARPSFGLGGKSSCHPQ